MTQIPKSILLGGQTIDIVSEDGFYHKVHNLSTGYASTGEIKIAERAPLALKREHVFILLYMHICHMVLGNDTEEPCRKWVVGRQLFGLIRDNPGLLDINESIFNMESIRYIGKPFRIMKRPAVMDKLATLDCNMLAIDVMEDAKLDLQWLYLYHEIIHLIRINLAFSVEEDEEEERIVDSTAFLLLALLSQNDMTWILDDGDEGLIEYHPCTLSGIE